MGFLFSRIFCCYHFSFIENLFMRGFWYYTTKWEKRLFLLADMKLLGETWLECKIEEKYVLCKTLTFLVNGMKRRFY